MSETKHTLEKWVVGIEPRGKNMWGLSILTADGGLIADLSGHYRNSRTRADVDPFTEANARLFAASPGLLAALKECENLLIKIANIYGGTTGENGCDTLSARANARAAIQRAEGG